MRSIGRGRRRKCASMRRPLLVALWIVATVATTASRLCGGQRRRSRGDRSTPYLGRRHRRRPQAFDHRLNHVRARHDTRPPSHDFSGHRTTTVRPRLRLPAHRARPPTTSIDRSTSSTASTPPPRPPAPGSRPRFLRRGGLVIVSYRPGEVRLESVAPTPGFSYEIDDAGPAGSAGASSRGAKSGSRSESAGTAAS